MTEKQIIQTLMLKVEQARTAQNNYFNSRNDVNLRTSKSKEAELDAYLKQLRRMGYQPESNNITAKQNSIF